MDTSSWHSIVCGWYEVNWYIKRNPNAELVVEATGGRGAVRVLLPTTEARDAFIAADDKKVRVKKG